MQQPLLQVKDLEYSFATYGGEVSAVRGVSFDVFPGETLAIVGESGSGKSVTVQSIMKLLPSPPGRLKKGSILFDGQDITHYTEKQMGKLRGSQMSMIFQDPMTSLNPTMRIGRQITEGLRLHQHLSAAQAAEKARDLLSKVGIPNPEKTAARYPHMLSGGMRQRVMISMALAAGPKILFADEPTTALDVTTQAQILELMNQLKQETGTAVVLITHDLGVVARMAQRVLVMYAGKIVESGSLEQIFFQPSHPYTRGLLESIPAANTPKNKRLFTIPGTPPDLFAPPEGCGFFARCSHCMEVCRTHQPPFEEIQPGHAAACWLNDPRAGGTPQDARKGNPYG